MKKFIVLVLFMATLLTVVITGCVYNHQTNSQSETSQKTEASLDTSSIAEEPETPIVSESSDTSIKEEVSHVSTDQSETSQEEVSELTPEVSLPQNQIDWEAKREEAPEATEIWLIMKEFGWTDAACAGLLGNIMRECGGNTLENINHKVVNSRGTHFGLCQWSKKYYPEIQPTDTWMPSVREQVEFLRYSIAEYNGKHHSYGGVTIEFLSTAEDPREVARIFCEEYERPNETSERRENFALIAYEYFTGMQYQE